MRSRVSNAATRSTRLTSWFRTLVSLATLSRTSSAFSVIRSVRSVWNALSRSRLASRIFSDGDKITSGLTVSEVRKSRSVFR